MKHKSPHLSNALPALRRAAKNALKLAKQTGTPCVVWRNGRIVNLNAGAKKKNLISH